MCSTLSFFSRAHYSVLSPPVAVDGVVTPLFPLSAAPPGFVALEPPTVGEQTTVGADEPGPQVSGLAVAPLLAAPPNDPAPCEVPMPGGVGAEPAPCVVLGLTDPPDGGVAPVWAMAMLLPAIIAIAAVARRYLRIVVTLGRVLVFR
jgi:hypothetical protein